MSQCSNYLSDQSASHQRMYIDTVRVLSSSYTGRVSKTDLSRRAAHVDFPPPEYPTSASM